MNGTTQPEEGQPEPGAPREAPEGNELPSGASRRSLRTSRQGSAARGASSRAGRDLPAAIGVGVVLLLLVLTGLLFVPVAFVATVAVFGVFGCWEVSRALSTVKADVPPVPLAVGSVALPFAAYYGGEEAIAFALTGTAALVLLWRLIEGGTGALRSILASLLTILWIPTMLSFGVLLFNEANGALKVATLLLLVVANDTFGYLVGASLGKHPMAPKISPKKSWEGFAGSVAGAVVVGVLAAVFLLHQPWWAGVILAIATVAAATAGDLSESMVKRELGIKDMSNMLPGHGGVMDRLDSIVFATPVAYILSVLLLPGAL
jgi:phosphatidate cytidylyltransferase